MKNTTTGDFVKDETGEKNKIVHGISDEYPESDYEYIQVKDESGNPRYLTTKIPYIFSDGVVTLNYGNEGMVHNPISDNKLTANNPVAQLTYTYTKDNKTYTVTATQSWTDRRKYILETTVDGVKYTGEVTVPNTVPEDYQAIVTAIANDTNPFNPLAAATSITLTADGSTSITLTNSAPTPSRIIGIGADKVSDFPYEGP